ncbi:MAG TPA: zinc-dependent metalloprotease [Acidobacteriaceae bacterium]|nr:zinc-dependent metalloprotease [Acidobacteriaceae bacterium]
MRSLAIFLVPVIAVSCTMQGQADKESSGAAEAKPAPTIAARTATMQHMPGLLPLDWDAKTGKLYLEIPLSADQSHTRSQDLLYTDSLPYGMGSNDVGLDRGQISEGRIVHFERTGPKVLLVEPNSAFRTSSTDQAEQLAVRQSFPESVLGGFKVEAEGPDGTVLVDATDFFLRDVHHVAQALARTKQGSYKIDASRSTIALDHTKAFPKNTEVEAELTFALDGEPQGHYVQEVTPDASAMTVRERQSFVELPPPGFTPRRFSPRAGYFPTSYRDMNAPLGDSIDQQFIIRHRLIKRDPNCTRACVAVMPIQYYVDRGAPEPIRTALLEGARWWDQAFQAAGWAPGTFRVDLLPEDADPMDVRYNIIQWVHRYTRGWSYGEAIADPRTGEIIKGNVTLGSLRARQDYLIAEALLAPYANGKAPADAAHDAALHMVLERIRQLAAHETGHTLGLAHNFAASSFPHQPTETMSVMDYPHPYVTLKDGVPDLSEAYSAGIGTWDKVAIDYGYREFDREGKPVEDAAALEKILADSEKTGMIFITDEDARPLGSAHPHAHLWDNGTDPADELNRVLEIRSAALARFGENAIKPGTDLAQLEDTLVPLYLFHRYQTEAAAKEIGGLDYRYNVRGDGQALPAIVSNDEQKKAIAAVLKTLSPEVLTLPESLLAILPPRPRGLPRTQESLPAETGLTFDPVASGEAAADLTLQLLLNPERAARIVQYHMRNPPSSTSLRVLMEGISAATARRIEGGHTVSSEVERAVEFRGLETMLALAVNPQASSQVRAIARWHINDLLKQWTNEPAPSDSAEAIHRAAMIARIQEFERDPQKFVAAKPLEAPPGMPIGEDEE